MLLYRDPIGKTPYHILTDPYGTIRDSFDFFREREYLMEQVTIMI